MYALSLLTLTLILITFLNLWNFYFDLVFESRPKKVGAPDCKEQNSLAFAIMFVENYKLYNFFSEEWLSTNIYPVIATFQSESSPEWNLIFENAFFSFFSCRRM